MKTLVIILSETRAHELTFENFKENVLDVLHADLCVCIGVKPDYDYNNPFYIQSKYHFTYNEPDDYGDAFEEAYQSLQPLNQETNPIYWREFLNIKDQFLGGIKGDNQHPGSAGILIFFRWFLLQKLTEHNLLHQYDRFIITRSDYIYQLPHPKLELLDEKYIWIPDSENYGGYTDRHVILNRENIIPYLNILNNIVLTSNEYFTKLKVDDHWNLEKMIKFNLDEQRQSVQYFPYIMYAVRNEDVSTRWAQGNYSNELGYYIKYQSEYDKSTQYKKDFENSNLSMDDFYKMQTNTTEGFRNKNPSWTILLLLCIFVFLWIKNIGIKMVLIAIATLLLFETST